MKDNNICGRRCDREFNENAVALVVRGKSISQVSRDLGVSQWSVGRWVAAARAATRKASPKSSRSAQIRDARFVGF